ncbi:hypothetical protein RB628_40975 [Streptomyces sp. ADMS]|uniref:hypothetical protein n=1 Tax=Streptomyces sp. ADMS TaxID=3071415 RepID=UPI00296EF367|nr:hypothetical protein [Streptomyces sp. ADMS]MDW4911491.1 hypothetical protein [Streptomyces sp. ADMS]
MASASSREARGLTSDELLAFPAVIDLDTANRALMIGRSTGYGLAKQGEYPVKVLRLGNAYRVVTADLLKLLGLERRQSGDGKPEARADEHRSHPRNTLGGAPSECLSELLAA